MDSPIRKLGFDILTLVDMEEAVTTMNNLWWGQDTTPTGKEELTVSDFGTPLFTIMRPRPGAIGALRDLNAEGCVILFFADFDSPVTGDRAEAWLQEWFVNERIELHQIRKDAGQSPVMLDCQAYFFAEGHNYEMPKDRPRIKEMKAGGKFDTKVIEAARKVEK